MNTPSRTVRLGLAAVLGVVALTGAWQLVQASDHQDTADVELNPTQDLTDFYAFPTTAGRIALVLNSHPFITPAEAASSSFDPNLLYQIKIDNTGDALEDLVLQVTFTGTGANQKVFVRGPFAPTVRGAMQNVVSSMEPAVTGTINTTLGSTSVSFFSPPSSVTLISLTSPTSSTGEACVEAVCASTELDAKTNAETMICRTFIGGVLS